MAANEQALLVEHQGRVTLLTLNRPAVRNAFNDALVEGLTQALRDAEREYAD